MWMMSFYQEFTPRVYAPSMQKRLRTDEDIRSGTGHSSERIVAELAELARNGSPADREHRRQEANAKWSAMSSYPILMVGVLLAISAAVPAVCFSGGIASYIGVGVLFLALMSAIVWMNGRHRDAYVERLTAQGMSRAEAERDYMNLYDGS
jgi:hypothetical protein